MKLKDLIMMMIMMMMMMMMKIVKRRMKTFPFYINILTVVLEIISKDKAEFKYKFLRRGRV